MAVLVDAIIRDTYGNIPVFGIAGRLFIASDLGQLFYDTGSAWVLITSGLLGEAYFPASLLYPSTTAGSAAVAKTEYTTNDVDMLALFFDASTQEHAQFTWWTPNDWDAGTVTAQVIWTAASGSGDVIWGVQGRAFANDDALDQAWGTAQEVTDSLITAADMHISPATSAITLAGTPAAGQVAQFRIYRKAADGADTLSVDAKLMGIKLFYGKA